MSRGKKVRQFSSEFKLKAVERLLAGESASVVAQEFKVVRKLLYYWKDAYISEGPDGLRKVGRPRKDRRVGVLPEAQTDRGELLQARKRIAELERKIGHQANANRFFRRSLAAHGCDRQRAGRQKGAAVYALIREQEQQGGLSIDEMCWIAGVNRGGYYRRWKSLQAARGRDGVKGSAAKACLGASTLRLSAHRDIVTTRGMAGQS